jgi:hypothetical protein
MRKMTRKKKPSQMEWGKWQERNKPHRWNEENDKKEKPS